MAGDQGNPGFEPGAAVALEQRPYGHANDDPRVERDQQRRQQTEPGAVGHSRLFHRIGILTLFVAIGAVQVLWVILLGQATVWLGEQLLS